MAFPCELCPNNFLSKKSCVPKKLETSHHSPCVMLLSNNYLNKNYSNSWRLFREGHLLTDYEVFHNTYEINYNKFVDNL